MLRFWGKYRATVSNNEDPEYRGRIRVTCPLVYGRDTGSGNLVVSPWALPCFGLGGNRDYGTFAVPIKGSAVWIEFEQGDPDKPVWVGSWIKAPSGIGTEAPKEAIIKEGSGDRTDWNNQEGYDEEDNAPISPDISPNRIDPKNYVFRSAEGHIIELDDTEGQLKLKITDKSGQFLLFRPEDGNGGGPKILLKGAWGQYFIINGRDGAARIELKDKSGNIITLQAEEGWMLLKDSVGDSVELKDGIITLTALVDVNINTLGSKCNVDADVRGKRTAWFQKLVACLSGLSVGNTGDPGPGNIHATGDMYADGNLIADSDLQVSENAYIDGNLRVGGTFTLGLYSATLTMEMLAELIGGGITTLHSHPGVEPSDTVESETSFGISSDAGESVEYSRGDHTHGTPIAPSVPLPSGTVVTETAFGQSSTSGTAATFSRGDHTHGTPGAPSNPIPVGLICMWSGVVINIPIGWHLCNGSDGTPDLRSKFIKGADAGEDPGETGGSNTHDHAVVAAGSNSAPTFSGNAMLAHGHPLSSVAVSSDSAGTPAGSIGAADIGNLPQGPSLSTLTPKAHVHTFTGVGMETHSHTATPTIAGASAGTPSGSVSAPTFTGSEVTSGSASSEPAYYALAFIMYTG